MPDKLDPMAPISHGAIRRSTVSFSNATILTNNDAFDIVVDGASVRDGCHQGGRRRCHTTSHVA